MFKNYSKYGSLVIIIMYLVGVIGFYFNPDFFNGLTEIHLWVVNLTLILPLIKNFKSIFGILVVSTLGFLIEVAGVETKLIFGDYHYGNILGDLYWGVPLIIGMNWAVLLYAAFSLITIKDKWLASFIIALIVAGLDFLIEPVAMKQLYWYWPNDIVPIQNYIAWFILSFCFVQVYYLLKVKPGAKILAACFLGAQIIFFTYLQLLN